jgi:hypothetical protein
MSAYEGLVRAIEIAFLQKVDPQVQRAGGIARFVRPPVRRDRAVRVAELVED